MVLPLGDVERTRIIPFATYILIAINVAVYVLQVDRGDEFTVSHAATPFEISNGVDLAEPIPVTVATAGRDEPGDGPGPIHYIEQAEVGFPIWLTLLTSLFLHGSPLHLAGNMLYLWIFGDNVEEVLGRLRYVIVYLLCGISGTLLQIVANPDSLIPTLGASGAIAGVMGMYLIWFPHNRVRVLIFQFLTVVPAIVVIGLWILMQIGLSLNSLGQTGTSGGVAYLAHVGGAGVGVGFAFLFRNRAIALQARDYEGAWFEGGRSEV